MSIEADPALGVPYGNDLVIPRSVWKVVFVYCSRRALSHIGVGFMGWCPGIYIGGYLRQNDAYGFVVIFLFQEGRSMNVAVSSVLTAAE